MKAKALLFTAFAFALAACGEPATQQSETPVYPLSQQARGEMDRINSASTVSLALRPADQPAGEPAAQPQPTEAAPGVQAAEAPAQARFDAGLTRIQVLLDRAHFSPGVIDGFDGENVRKAVSEYQARNDLPVTGVADDALLQRLAGADSSPALITYTIQQGDVAGPFVTVPTDLEAQSRLERLNYASPEEGLAEKFHMDVDLLRTLNPGANFAQAGTELVVANAGGELSGQVASIEVDKRTLAVRALDASGQLLAYYPATIGSSDAPAPSGDYEVRAVAFNPTYNYDPERLPTFGQRDHGALTIAAGPNNPVGAVWIALSLDTYGIHGTPDPSKISKTQSHGCVRLTNWDATELGRAVRQGVPVRFVERASQAARGANANEG